MAKSRKARPAGAIKNQVRQGDVLVTPVASETAKRGKQRETRQGRVVLADGEVTGHSHDVVDSKFAVQYDDSEFASTAILDVEVPTKVVHQEHSEVSIAPATYEVRRKEEWTDADEPRQVAD